MVSKHDLRCGRECTFYGGRRENDTTTRKFGMILVTDNIHVNWVSIGVTVRLDCSHGKVEERVGVRNERSDSTCNDQ